MRSRVAKLVAKFPDIDAATVAAKLPISERTARRHLAAIVADNARPFPTPPAAIPAAKANGHPPAIDLAGVTS